jgi:hypothetical protein
MALPIWFKLDSQLAFCAVFLALANTGNKIAARIAMIAMTTNSSISVKPLRVLMEVLLTTNVHTLRNPLAMPRMGANLNVMCFGFLLTTLSFHYAEPETGVQAIAELAPIVA